MQQEPSILRDVELRLKALDELVRLKPAVNGALAQLRESKQLAAEAENGSTSEQRCLREAAEVSARLALLWEELHLAEKELRRTAYLVELLSSNGE